MICLTGDIHHKSLKTKEQKFLTEEETEVKIALRFLKIVEKYNIKITFFITGKSFTEEWQDLKFIILSNLVEIGGHTYSGIPASKFYKILCKIRKGYLPTHAPNYGCFLKQKKDIKKMIDVVKEKVGIDIMSWRSHGYIHDSNTYYLLSQMGIKIVSDEISCKEIYPYKLLEGLISLPINVIPDHDHIYHAHRNKEFVEQAKKANYGKDSFGNDSYDVQTWGELVKEQVFNIEKNGGIATVLMHPLCMYLSDGFKTAEKLISFFSNYNTIWTKEIYQKGFYKK